VNLVGAQTQRSDTSVKSPEAAAGLYYSVQSGPLGLVRCCSVRFGSGRLLSARVTLRRRYFLEVSQRHKTIYKQNKHKRCMVNRSVATGQGCGSRGAPPRRPQQVGVLSCGAIYLVGESIGERSNQHTQRPTSHGHHPPRCGVFDFLHLLHKARSYKEGSRGAWGQATCGVCEGSAAVTGVYAMIRTVQWRSPLHAPRPAIRPHD
jgi:hypothetical protein